MFTKFPIYLWDILESPAEIAVMLRIMLRMTGDGWGVCYETREKMAEACKISPKTVTEVIKTLEIKKLIHVERKHRKCNQITLHPDVKKVLEGKLDLQTRSILDLDGGFILPPRKDQEVKKDEPAKRSRNKIQSDKGNENKADTKKTVKPKYFSELDRIHEQYLQKKAKEEKEGS